MMIDMQTGQPLIVRRLQRGIRLAASAAVALIAVAMITAFVYALANMLHATFGAYILASLMTFALLTLGVAAMLPHFAGEE